MGIVTPVVSSK